MTRALGKFEFISLCGSLKQIKKHQECGAFMMKYNPDEEKNKCKFGQRALAVIDKDGDDDDDDDDFDDDDDEDDDDFDDDDDDDFDDDDDDDDDWEDEDEDEDEE
ncbi:MAG: hypothetical protein ACHQUC_03730 [Chlamydiales bacterium]